MTPRRIPVGPRPARRPSAGFARLLAVALLLQWGLAFAGSAPSAHAVEICSVGGTHTVLLDDAGRPVQPALHAHGCAMCCGAVAADLATPPVLAVPVGYAAPPIVALPAGRPVPPARAPPQQPRAPPEA